MYFPRRIAGFKASILLLAATVLAVYKLFGMRSFAKKRTPLYRLMILSHWERFAKSVWPLNYRADARNGRLSNRKAFLG